MKKIALVIFTWLIGINSQESLENVVIVEGFYSSSWESSVFYEIRNNKVYTSDWLIFNNKCELSDSISKIFDRNQALTDFYLKVKAVKRDSDNYGHLGSYKREFEVLNIIEIDTSYSLENFLENKN